ncbi:DNA-directed RNA polymerase [Synchytrium microbalum]|uniref:DNA-directed RNA polymerase subunit n=1 Tax=Synchytrium microbalum TaxID=1806994 RepID=A0A507C9Q6_9FUNG|nr:DNA-directed RNA polymerase [Synchytrium microbalum]TPX35899.1 DNA-directed RNA polymerase [Synchytrium microbalum]
MDIARPVTKEVSAVSFSFYSAEEVKRLSVKRITNPILVDTLGHPTRAGLYDPSLGPLTPHDICSTCNLNYFACPGHFGHIELAAPCYNPVTFRLMLKLLASTCLYCHKFRHSRVVIAITIAKLKLVQAGLVLAANDIENVIVKSKSKAQGAKRKKMADSEPVDEDEDEGDDPGDARTEADFVKQVGEYVAKAMTTYTKEHGHPPPLRAGKLTHSTETARKIEHEFLGSVPPRYCTNCRGVAHKYRAEGNRKVFEKRLSSKVAMAMDARGLTLQNVFAAAVSPIKRAGTDDASNDGRSSPRRGWSRASSVDSEGSVERLPNIQQALGGMSRNDMEAGFHDIQQEEERSARLAEAEDQQAEFEQATAKATAVTPISLTSSREARYVPPIEVRAHLNMLWDRERSVLDLLYGHREARHRISSSDIFFYDILTVTPTKFRPASKMDDALFEHPQNTHLINILKANSLMGTINKNIKQLREDGADANESVTARNKKMSDLMKRMVNAWISLQDGVNGLIDSSKVATYRGKEAPAGVRQILEKKEGLFRKHMMGKRVNYAARSVISPDPYIETNEIGIPPVFATKLTYPEPVTQYNATILRAAVINGPDKWPGATHVQNEDGTLVSLSQFTEQGRAAIAQTLLTPPAMTGRELDAMSPNINKKVHRHVRNGDFLLLNRQPTLHKPSIMAHTARILPGEKTLRMHYANCNTYNADFDGDEMNAHLPQTELGRAEAMIIARTDQQYLVPTAGDVLRGLIQDHVDAGVDLTSRDTFLEREQFMQLLYVGLRPESRQNGGTSSMIGDGNIESEVIIGDMGRVIMVEPAIWKPKPLWTGKQVISAILLNLTHSNDRNPLNLRSKARIPAKSWGPSAPEEQTVLVLDGHLIQGILDKSQFGATAHGLVHGVYEIYGATYAGKLLSIFGRVFTAYLQYKGFTCRMDDLRLTQSGDLERTLLIAKSLEIGREGACEYVKATPEEDVKSITDDMITSRLEDVLRSSERMAGLDATMKNKTNKLTSEIISACIPDKLLKPFPGNNMQMMTVSGAKGSNVNVSQISCLLGQQELEGRRVPTMVSGKTLPSFQAFDSSARSGGYITGRFFSGIRPQEYYFHCMAGREGLIDTAVKTSRSGYLQRCLIKHLEGATVAYDHTVRDADGSVLQFLYGEDALDVMKQKALTKFDLAALNYATLKERYKPEEFVTAGVDTYTVPDLIKVREKRAKRFSAIDAELDEDDKKQARDDLVPVLSMFMPSRYMGSVSESFMKELDDYIKLNAENLLHTKGSNPNMRWTGNSVVPKHFRPLMLLKYMYSLADPGEAVGLLAAQGLGEPSTQMTLNTFHFAGFGAKNVTLGIPRLREIIMTASSKIKTPLMRLPLLPGAPTEYIDMLCRKIGRLALNQITEGVTVRERLRPEEDGKPRRKVITVRLQLWHKAAYEREHGIKAPQLKQFLSGSFIPQLENIIKFNLKLKKSDDDVQAIGVQLGTFGEQASSGAATGGDDAEASTSAEKKGKKLKEKDDDNDDDDADGMDASAAKRARNTAQHATYDAPDEEEQVIMDSHREVEEDLDDDHDDDDAEDGQEAGAGKKKKGKGKAAAAKGETEDGDDEDLAVKEEEGEFDIDLRKRDFAAAFRFDDVHGAWCEIDLEFEAKTKKLLMVDLVEKACHRLVLSEIKGITRCYPMVNESENDTSVNLGTEGVNFRGIWELDKYIDVNKIYTNDIYAVLTTYGVEAARAAIVGEIASVFGVYGISVDKRHLSLIADYMTFEGGYKAFNRMGMNSNPSPFAQMSFETTTSFLTAATLSGDFDSLQSPSARLVMGQPTRGGTGAFQIRHPINTPIGDGNHTMNRNVKLEPDGDVLMSSPSSSLKK